MKKQAYENLLFIYADIKILLNTAYLGQDVDLTAEVFDPHTVAGLLKLHFREMRVSLISRGQTMADAVHAVQQKQVMRTNNHCVVWYGTLLLCCCVMCCVPHACTCRWMNFGR